MRPARARKSSTSSGRPATPRTRYLGVELSGEPLPALSTSRWAAWLRSGRSGEAPPSYRLVRFEGGRAVVKVAARDAQAARKAWDGAGVAGDPALTLRTARTWGTLVGAKAWLAARRRSPGARGQLSDTA